MPASGNAAGLTAEQAERSIGDQRFHGMAGDIGGEVAGQVAFVGDRNEALRFHGLDGLSLADRISVAVRARTAP